MRQQGNMGVLLQVQVLDNIADRFGGCCSWLFISLPPEGRGLGSFAALRDRGSVRGVRCRLLCQEDFRREPCASCFHLSKGQVLHTGTEQEQASPHMSRRKSHHKARREGREELAGGVFLLPTRGKRMSFPLHCTALVGMTIAHPTRGQGTACLRRAERHCRNDGTIL
jgi:hypothetical protein